MCWVFCWDALLLASSLLVTLAVEFGMYSLPDEGHFSSSSSFLRDFVCVVVKESLLPDG